eukprot:4279392-Amphidinium_carterae.1
MAKGAARDVGACEEIPCTTNGRAIYSHFFSGPALRSLSLCTGHKEVIDDCTISLGLMMAK